MEVVKEYLGGLIGIPMIFDGNCLCPECLHLAMNVCGGNWICRHCKGVFPATLIVDRWGKRWLKLMDSIR